MCFFVCVCVCVILLCVCASVYVCVCNLHVLIFVLISTGVPQTLEQKKKGDNKTLLERCANLLRNVHKFDLPARDDKDILTNMFPQWTKQCILDVSPRIAGYFE